jgi:hypothetical protein
MATNTYPDRSLVIQSSTVATDTTTLTNTGMTVGTTIFGSTYTNAITGDEILMETPNNSRRTEIVPATVNLSQTNSGVASTISNSFAQGPYVSMTATSTSNPPDFPAINVSLSTAGLSANNSFGWNLDVAKLNLNGASSTTGQVITANANGRPIWTTPQPIVSTLEYYITATSPFFQYPPVAPTQALITSYQYYGWYFINSVALRNIAWFFAPDYAMTVADVKGLYLNYFNITTTSNDNLPFLTIYTKPTGVNDFFPNFAHSARTFAPTFSTSPASPYCSFMNISGVQPDPFPYGHQLGAMVIANTRGEYLPTEEVLAVAIGTNTASPVGQCNFIFQKVGICLEQGNAELVLNPQNILDPTVNSIGMVDGTLSASSSTVATNTTTVSNTGVTVGTTSFGSTYTNTITGDKTLLQTPNNSRTTEIVPATVNLSQTNSGVASTISNSFGQGPYVSMTATSTSNPPDFPAINVSLSTAGLSANNSFGWNLDVAKLNLNGASSTTGQVITADANGRPIWGSPATPYISSTGVASGGITSLPSIDASGTLLLGTNSATTAITVGSASASELLLIPPLKVGTLGNAGVAGQYLTSSSGGANTWTTPYVNASNGRVAGNLLLQGNDITGVDAIDGNSGGLSIGRGAGTTSAISIGKAGIPIDLNNTIRVGAEGSLSAGLANQVITSQGAGLPTVYKFPTLASLQNPIAFSGQGFAAGANNFSYNRTVITAPNVGAKYLFFLTTTINSNNSGNVQNAFVSLAYTDGDTNVTPSNGFNMVNGLTTAGGNVLTATTAMAVVRSGTVTTTTQTVSPTWIYTWAGALTKSFAMVNCGGPDFSIGHGRISYIQIS